jgi:pyruvate-formate lyase-activating enzyme
MKLMRLPWEGKHVPHGTLDIMSDCNISCRGCYNQRSGSPKSIEQVLKDLADMVSFRHLHTVTLTGGEVTLHPNLAEIVKCISAQGIKTAIVTNGVLLDGAMLEELKDAGIDLVILHIQADQTRPDLPELPTLEDAETLRNRKLQLIADHGIEAGVSYIIYKNRVDELERLVNCMLSTEHTSFALLTMYSDFSKFVQLRGSVQTGLRSGDSPQKDDTEPRKEEVHVDELLKLFSRLGLKPFAYVAANNSISMKRWYTFLSGSVVRRDGSFFHRSLKSSILESVMIKAYIQLAGRTPFFHKPSRNVFRGHLLLNGLLGGDVRNNLRVLRESYKRDSSLQDKHFVLQRAPELLPSGEVVFCRDCPDATIRNGILVPACLVDRMADDQFGNDT